MRLRAHRQLRVATRFSSLLTLSALLCLESAFAAETAKKATAPALPTGTISDAAWKAAPTALLKSAEIDRLVAQELGKAKIQPAALTTDEQFVRRVWLDLTGSLPMPADVKDFLSSRDPNKRAKLIDKLLASDEYARHWAHYWRNVIASRTSDQRGQRLAGHFDKWMTEELKKNVPWDTIVRAMITASGSIRFDDPDRNGAAYFLASHFGPDGTTERAAEASRIFLGIQIQCAQCHDHPSDVWKRKQFHEFAAYFARLKEQPLREEKKLAGFKLASLPKAEYQMPSKEDPKKGTPMQPRFLDGKSPGVRLPDQQRRKALADAITSQSDPWFAAAYVNRIWGELMGQSFYQPVDDLGPEKEAVFPTVLARVAAGFRGSHFDMKGLFRVIMNSQTYQRQLRPGESGDDHLLFAAAYPTRLSADALWQSLVDVLGRMGPPAPLAMKGKPGKPAFVARGGLELLFKQEFNFDPSTKPEEIEGSLSQTLLLMNNPVINQKIQARGTNLLARILTSYADNSDALRMVYLRTLARRPTDRELVRCRDHVQIVGNRAEAFEDILWALINSTEFQTKR
jgi:Protein of unknown function (DUF1549)/Protein of unknown function (DUF1553)